jgi:hypothetical protein
MDYNGEDGFIFCSTPNMVKIKDIDILMIDEVQNLVKYAAKILANLPIVDKLILISATPELYLIGEKDYYYLRLNRKNKVKKTINKYYSRQHHKLLREFIDPNKNQLIFYNNKEESKKIFTKESFGIDFTFINSDSREDVKIKKAINDEMLPNGHMVCTSFISDGLNFKNLQWDDIIIVGQDSLMVDEIYQLSNRFRNVQDLNINYISVPRPSKLNAVIDYDKFKYQWGLKASWEQIEHAKKKYSIQ